MGSALLSAEEIEMDGERCSIAFTLDITDRKQAEDDLRRLNAELEQRVEARTAEVRSQQAQLNALLDTMGESMVYIEKRLIRYVNRTFAMLVGYTSEELIGQPISILSGVSEEGKSDDIINQLLVNQFETVS